MDKKKITVVINTMKLTFMEIGQNVKDRTNDLPACKSTNQIVGLYSKKN